MNNLDKQSEKELSFIPKEYQRHISLLSKDEILLLNTIKDNKKSRDKIDYLNFGDFIIETVKREIGKNPNLEFLAAEIAYDNRRFDDLKFLAERSNNPELLYYLSMGFVEKNQIEKADEILKLSETHVEINDETILHEYLLAKAILSKAKGDYLGSLFTILAAKEYVKKTNLEEINYKTSLVRILSEESNILLHLGRLSDAKESINEGLEISYNLKNKHFIIIFELLYGNYVIEFERDFSMGSEYHKNAAKMAQELRNPYLIALTLEAISTNLKKQRKLKEGMKFCKQALAIYNNLGDERHQLIIANTIADLHLSFGNISKALEILKKLEKIDESDLETILNLINTYIRLDDLDNAEAYLAKAKKLIKGKGWVIGNYQIIFFEGLIKLQSGIFDEAEELLIKARDLAKEDNLDYLATQASIQLISILVNKNLTFQSRRNYTNAMKSIEELHQSKKIEIDSFDYDSIELIKAILFFSNKEYNQAKEIFTALQKNFENYGEVSRRKIVADYLEKINSTLLKKQLSIENDDTSEISYLSTNIIYQNIESTDKPIYSRESQPVSFIIVADSGIPIFSYSFEKYFGMDKALISGFITAIVHFTDELQSSKEEDKDLNKDSVLKSIKHGEFEILMEKRKGFIAAIITNKETYSLRRNLMTIANRLEQYLKKFDIDFHIFTIKQSNYIMKLILQVFDDD